MTGEARPVARMRTVLLVFVAVIALGYAVVALLYNPGGGLVVTSSDDLDGDVRVRVEVVSLDPADYAALLRLRVTDLPASLLNEDERISVPLRLAVTASDGTDDFVFPAGTALGRAEVTVGVSGDQSAYPFDIHDAAVMIDASIVPNEGATAGARPVPVTILPSVVGGASGWDTTAQVNAEAESVLITFEFARSFSTIFFAILLVIMALVIAAYSIAVGTATFTGRQPIDSSIVGWGAALLFALLALRFYLPGDPPVGSGIDVFAYMWITLTAFIGLSMGVTMWLRREWESPGGSPSD